MESISSDKREVVLDILKQVKQAIVTGLSLDEIRRFD